MSIFAGRSKRRSARPWFIRRTPVDRSDRAALRRLRGGAPLCALPVPSLEWNLRLNARPPTSTSGEGRHSVGRVAVLRALRQGDQRAQARAQRRHPRRTTTRRRKSTIASPISSATCCSSRARPRRSTPMSSCNAACTSWPRPRRFESAQDRAHSGPEVPAARSPRRSPARTCGCCAGNSRAFRSSPM